MVDDRRCVAPPAVVWRLDSSMMENTLRASSPNRAPGQQVACPFTLKIRDSVKNEATSVREGPTPYLL